MNTPLILFALASAAIGISYATEAPEVSAIDLPTVNPDRSCKPSGPIDVDLRQVHDYGDGSVQVELRVSPLLAMGSLRWQLDLEPGMQLMKGPGAGHLGLARGKTATRRMRIKLPSSLGSDFTRLGVRVRGTFQGSDASNGSSLERVVVTRSLSWGEPVLQLPESLYVDRLSGAEVRYVELPSSVVLGAGATHKAGR